MMIAPCIIKVTFDLRGAKVPIFTLSQIAGLQVLSLFYSKKKKIVTGSMVWSCKKASRVLGDIFMSLLGSDSGPRIPIPRRESEIHAVSMMQTS